MNNVIPKRFGIAQAMPRPIVDERDQKLALVVACAVLGISDTDLACVCMSLSSKSVLGLVRGVPSDQSIIHVE